LLSLSTDLPSSDDDDGEPRFLEATVSLDGLRLEPYDLPVLSEDGASLSESEGNDASSLFPLSENCLPLPGPRRTSSPTDGHSDPALNIINRTDPQLKVRASSSVASLRTVLQAHSNSLSNPLHPLESPSRTLTTFGSPLHLTLDCFLSQGASSETYLTTSGLVLKVVRVSSDEMIIDGRTKRQRIINEYETYCRLEPIQGKFVPRCHGLWCSESRGIMVLVLDHAGRALDERYRGWSGWNWPDR